MKSRFLILAALLAANAGKAATLTEPRTKLSVTLDGSSGAYTVSAGEPGWNFGGVLPEPCKETVSLSGADPLGAYQELDFSWNGIDSPMKGGIRLYKDKPVILFFETCLKSLAHPFEPFPDFGRVPRLHIFSYAQDTFSPPVFAASECSTPWLLFDDQAHAAVISPDSHFMVASMAGDGQTRIASGLNPGLANIPAGFTQQTLFVFGAGINHTWDLWGSSLNALRGARRPSNDADTVLKYFGYWTDNGATYYYNYDPDKGYAGTLKALVEHYRSESIPVGYLQLDSWWYQKSFTGPDGKLGAIKQPKLPPGAWNRYGGLIEYKADPALFPEGLDGFQKELSIPFVTHNRWMDPASPYRKDFKVSGLAAIDPRWWAQIADYLKSCGIVTYEQDWLDRIYHYSPEFASTVDTGAAFLREMARACAARGITLQYCMAYPCFFMEGSQYGNLTSIRVSQDRFGSFRWNPFLYTSRLASSLGIWPWADVFMSSETDNLILSTLSAGPVGVGDPIGKEDKANIGKVARADGVIVKPDVPCVPLDQCYLRGLSGPMLASTYTDHGGLRTAYVFAYSSNLLSATTASFSPSELGFKGDVYVYEPLADAAKRIKATDSFSISLPPYQSCFYVIAPVGPGGLAFLGDSGKFVGTGKQRISQLSEGPDGIRATIVACASEHSIELHGFAPKSPAITVAGGKADSLNFDNATDHYTVTIHPAAQSIAIQIKPSP